MTAKGGKAGDKSAGQGRALGATKGSYPCCATDGYREGQGDEIGDKLLALLLSWGYMYSVYL